ncbi:fumarylacetoacetate hydrolase family protein [Advenella mimigardefordensis]|uniref:4-hydroxyphenylacetate degradation bifunctional isomerase/decarboxylase n=1 Tax=Advenella mimigardefordensis (strain DSM 17166 / LMG 22922 / DPN7) TaxID=1247726 RepID=W0PAG5_ADVMD|nr:fumarylacetoacetate hydrolase family protein [Advenella mimigardefordensis]AHG63839.1 4-hydroxyphenylacetate degradation bifunctional isomerase/decarboxylase [Advenella mimigardefordensis DPN7]
MQAQYSFLSKDLRLGTVYGTLLNDRATIERLASQFDSPPYRAAPKAPVLYIKPRNTFAGDGSVVSIPSDPALVRVDATLGLVIGRNATRVSVSEAMTFVAGFIIVSDLTLPHENYYRPAIVQRNRDGFCPMSRMFALTEGFSPDQASLSVSVNDQPVYERSFATLIRPAAQLIVDVTEFMTLTAGDVLLLGPGEGSPNARPGDRITITVPNLGQLNHSVAEEVLA